MYRICRPSNDRHCRTKHHKQCHKVYSRRENHRYQLYRWRQRRQYIDCRQRSRYDTRTISRHRQPTRASRGTFRYKRRERHRTRAGVVPRPAGEEQKSSDSRKQATGRDNRRFYIEKKLINKRERAILITSLVYAVDKIANTVGHYDAYRKNGDLEKELILKLPQIENENNKNNKIFCMDANELVKKFKADIVYIDPPYNSRQYSDAYHFLENIATNEKPDVFGVARKMDRTHIKSKYCLSSAKNTLEDLIENIEAKYILFSYNNTQQKANSRSNARISDDEILKILKYKGEVTVFEKDFIIAFVINR